MRYVVHGVGAIGGVVAARLAASGADVVAIARGAHREAIARSGALRVRTPDGEAEVKLRAVGSPAELDWRAPSAVLLATKTQDADAALRDLRRAAGTAVPIVCLENGVEGARLALRRFDRVLGALLMLPTAHLEPGIVEAYSTPCPGVVDVGRFPHGEDPLAAELAAALRAAGFASEARADIQRWQYAKLLTNLANAVQAACPPDAALGDLVRALRDEATACLRAAGIAWVPDDEFRARHRSHVTPREIAGQKRAGGSSWQSLERASGSIEADFLNGEIALLGRLHGVPAPLNAALQTLAEELAQDRRPPGSLSSDELARRLGWKPAR
ncbi:MAG TPA: 2-dehydropantoate 2-reductase N-terminal domain-containing protein [Myxococcota bacterium]|nr:2-dehydropantoate 2-reductase N-terminal domain-containing protein [Myxococcota bacterium]